jgi:hypothetical protein
VDLKFIFGRSFWTPMLKLVPSPALFRPLKPGLPFDFRDCTCLAEFICLLWARRLSW